VGTGRCNDCWEVESRLVGYLTRGGDRAWRGVAAALAGRGESGIDRDFGVGVPGLIAEEHDAVNHPQHYTSHPSGVECITVVEHFNFNRGNAIKYIWRAGEKGNEIEDLKKATWYVQREIDRISKGGR
jgi:hypothetical protein